MRDREDITRMKVVHKALQELAEEVVFMAGATVALYADKPSGEARPTDVKIDWLNCVFSFGDLYETYLLPITVIEYKVMAKYNKRISRHKYRNMPSFGEI